MESEWSWMKVLNLFCNWNKVCVGRVSCEMRMWMSFLSFISQGQSKKKHCYLPTGDNWTDSCVNYILVVQTLSFFLPSFQSSTNIKWRHSLAFPTPWILVCVIVQVHVCPSSSLQGRFVPGVVGRKRHSNCGENNVTITAITSTQTTLHRVALLSEEALAES